MDAKNAYISKNILYVKGAPGEYNMGHALRIILREPAPTAALCA
jgi:hypothetical protein